MHCNSNKDRAPPPAHLSTTRPNESVVRPEPRPLLWLNPKATPSGVSALGGRQIKGAFIATVRGKRQVLKRLGRARYPVAVQKQTFTPLHHLY